MRALLATVSCLFALSGFAGEPIPPRLVGVWATETALLRNGFLFEGMALYLGSDGIGALAFAPPPIGPRILATFSASTNTIDFRWTNEDGKILGSGRMLYDPMRQTIVVEQLPGLALYRRLTELTDSMRQALGIDLIGK